MGDLQPGDPARESAQGTPQPMGTTLASMVDGAGYIHMSGNYHRVPLSYIRSAAPNEVTGGWETPGMVGSDEAEVTYPAFVKVGNGDLLFFYKSGTSSGGDLVLKSYSATTKRWARVGMVLEGHDWDGPGTEDLSAYPSLAALPEPVPVASEYKQLAGACPRRSCAADKENPGSGTYCCIRTWPTRPLNGAGHSACTLRVGAQC